jgi:LPS-assembly protein
MLRICNYILSLLLITIVPAIVYGEDNFLSADKINYYEQEEYIEALGNVRAVIDKYTIYADRISYDIKNDEIYGYGNIRATLGKKELILGDSISFQKKSHKILISSFIQYFRKSDAVLAAKFAQRISKNHARLIDASYTPCPTCKNRKPLWEINSRKVDIIEDKHKVVYKNAWFKVRGIPLAFFPYFSHPMPGAPAQSGFLVPDVSRKRVGVPLYWRPRTNFDVTFTPRVGKKGWLYEADVRHLLHNGVYRINTSITNSRVAVKNIDSKNVTTTTRRQRYSISGDGDFSRDHIHYGFKLNSVSDKSYLKEYYNKDEAFLLSSAYVYKTQRSNFINVNNMHLQDLGANTQSSADPYVVPELM